MPVYYNKAVFLFWLFLNCCSTVSSTNYKSKIDSGKPLGNNTQSDCSIRKKS